MRFRIEQVYLTDDNGRVLPSDSRHDYFVDDAVNVEQVLDNFISRDGAEIVGSVLRLPGLQAIATVRRQQAVYTLQIVPATDSRRPTA
jgi:hypothetical protein